MALFGLKRRSGAVSARDAQALLDDGAILLDVREAGEWAAGRAPQAMHVPMGAIRSRIDRLDAGRPIVTVCKSGMRSGRVAAALRRAGFDARNLSGGMLAWQHAGMPVVTDKGKPGRIV